MSNTNLARSFYVTSNEAEGFDDFMVCDEPVIYNSVRNYKDSVFRMIFSDKKELLALYNALNNSHYDDPNELQTTTLENAIFMTIKNDISFILDSRILLFEQQSTFNPNMPLRDLFYIADLYQKIVKNEDLYRSAVTKIPSPEFVVFYNGDTKRPDREEFRLSDSFERKQSSPNLELKVTSLNINPGCNKELMLNCKFLHDYVLFVKKVREYTYAKTMSKSEAITRAVDECIKENVLAEFLKNQKAEVIKMTIYEFDEKLHEKSLIEEGKELGIQEGKELGIQEGKELGIEEGKELGIQEGKKAGEDLVSDLINALIIAGRNDEIAKAASDPSYREKLYKEFNLK